MRPHNGDAFSALENLLVDETSHKPVVFETDSSAAYIDTWSDSTKIDGSTKALSRSHSWDTVDSDLKGLGSFFDNIKPPPADPLLILSPSGGGPPRLLDPLLIPSQKSVESEAGVGKLHILSQPQEFRDCDIVFVHGLNGNAFSTWQSGNVLWPKDLLCDDFPEAGVYSFGYKTPTWSLSSPSSADTVAEKLLSEVSRIRYNDRQFNRPIIWVAHSLGGLIVKACLALSRSKKGIDTLQASINDSTAGVIFIGTPHHARTTLGWTSVLSKIMSVTTRSEKVAKVMNRSASNTSHFMQLLTSFDTTLEQSQISIFSFYETQEMVSEGQPSLVTQRDNALYHPSESVGALAGNHVTMCKFRNRLELGYVQIIRALQAIIEKPRVQTLNDKFLFPRDTEPKSGIEEEASSVMDSSVFSMPVQPRKLRRVKRMLTAPVLGRKHVPERSLGSCEWILDVPQFKDVKDGWLGSKTTLVITGPPGSGKSVLANYIVSHLQDELQVGDGRDSQRASILHFFFNAQADVKNSGEEMIHQFLQQLLEVNPSLVRHFPDEKIFGPGQDVSETRGLPEAVHRDVEDSPPGSPLDSSFDQAKFDSHALAIFESSTDEANISSARESPFNIDELLGILVSMLRDGEVFEVYFIIDGLDECDEKSLTLVTRLIDYINDIPWAKLCLTYRSDETLESKLKKHLGTFCTLDITAGDGFAEDLDTFIVKQMDFLTAQQRLPAAKLIEVEALLQEKRPGAYLYIMLITQFVAGLPDLQSINELLLITDGDYLEATLERFIQKCQPAEREKSDLRDVVLRGYSSPYDWINLVKLIISLNSKNSRVNSGEDSFQTIVEDKQIWNDQRLLSDLDRLYAWIFEYLSRKSSHEAFKALCFVGIARRPLTLQELSGFLVAEPEIANLDDFENSKRLDIKNWLNTELFGLLNFRGGVVSLINPSLKDFITQYLTKAGTIQEFENSLAESCLVLLCLPKRSSILVTHETNNFAPSIQTWEYAITYWSEHLRDSELLEWRLYPLVEEMWSNQQLQPLLLKFSRKNSLGVARPSLPCVLSALNLPQTLHQSLRLSRPNLLQSWKTKLSQELRFATANNALDSFKALQELGHEIKALDEYKCNVMDYAWGCTPEAVDELSRLTELVPTRNPAAAVLPVGMDPGTIAKLLGRGSLNIGDQLSEILSYAWQSGKISLSTELRQPSLDPKQAQKALEWAVDGERQDVVKKLLKYFEEHGQKILIQLGASLRLAAKKANVDIARLLLDSGANINEEQEQEPSALHYGALSGRLELVQLLVRYRARKSATDKKGRKPIHWAARRGHSKVVEFLISPTAEKADNGISTLFLACKSRSLPTIQVLLEYGASVNKKNEHGKTALHVAASRGSTDIVKLLLEEGGDPLVKSHKSQTTPLHEAALRGWGSVVSELLARGVPVDSRDSRKRTALHHACRSNNPSSDLIRILLDNGADLLLEDANKQASLQLAAKRGSPEMISILISSGAEVNHRDVFGMTALHYAAQYGQSAVAKELINAAAKVNAQDNDGRTALHHASTSNPPSEVLVKILLEAGANTSLVDKQGQKPSIIP